MYLKVYSTEITELRARPGTLQLGHLINNEPALMSPVKLYGILLFLKGAFLAVSTCPRP